MKSCSPRVYIWQDRVHRGRRAGRSLQTLWLCHCVPPKNIYWGPTFRLMGGKFHQVFLMFQSPKPCLSEIPISIIFKTAPWCSYNTWWPGAIFRITNGPPKKKVMSSSKLRDFSKNCAAIAQHCENMLRGQIWYTVYIHLWSLTIGFFSGVKQW